MFANDVDLNGAIDILLRGTFQAQQGQTFDLVTGTDIRLGSSFSILPPGNYSISHSIVDIGGGREALRIEITDVPGLDLVLPESIQVVKGVLTSGSTAELADSDNADLSIQRNPQSTQAVVQLVIEATSPTPVPNELRLRIESSVFARSAIDLKIEVFNVATDQYELLAIENAGRFSDSTFEHTFPDDPEHYLDDNDSMQARITYSSPVNRQSFRTNVDQIVWLIDD